MWLEVIDQVLSYFGGHSGRFLLVRVTFLSRFTILLELPLSVGLFYIVDAQEIERPFECDSCIFIEILTLEKQKLFPRIVLHPVLQLIDINTSGQIREVTMIETGVLLVGQYLLVFACQSLCFSL